MRKLTSRQASTDSNNLGQFRFLNQIIQKRKRKKCNCSMMSSEGKKQDLLALPGEKLGRGDGIGGGG